MEALFWIGLFGALYSYFLYPLLLLLVSRPRPLLPAAEELPSISLIVTAHNEARRIGAKLDNCLELDYPRERLEILVASDASDDETDDIVAGYADRGVRLVRAVQRQGQEWGQLRAVRAAQGVTLGFWNVATMLADDALRRTAVYSADATEGSVAREDRCVAPGGQLVGECLYVCY